VYCLPTLRHCDRGFWSNLWHGCVGFFCFVFLVGGVELSLSCGRRSVDQFVLVSGSPLRHMTRFYPYPFFSDNCFVVLPVGCPLWREDGSVTYSAIADWSGHWGPITIHYHTLPPLTTRRDYGGGTLTRLYTGIIGGGVVSGWPPPEDS
jgi:hypothetical protein